MSVLGKHSSARYLCYDTFLARFAPRVPSAARCVCCVRVLACTGREVLERRSCHCLPLAQRRPSCTDRVMMWPRLARAPLCLRHIASLSSFARRLLVGRPRTSGLPNCVTSQTVRGVCRASVCGNCWARIEALIRALCFVCRDYRIFADRCRRVHTRVSRGMARRTVETAGSKCTAVCCLRLVAVQQSGDAREATLHHHSLQ